MAEDTPVSTPSPAWPPCPSRTATSSPRELMLVRIAALAAVDAPAASYLLNAGAATDAGVTLEEVQGVLTAISPVVGSPRVVAAAVNLGEALGFAIAAAEAELELEGEVP